MSRARCECDESKSRDLRRIRYTRVNELDPIWTKLDEISTGQSLGSRSISGRNEAFEVYEWFHWLIHVRSIEKKGVFRIIRYFAPLILWAKYLMMRY